MASDNKIFNLKEMIENEQKINESHLKLFRLQHDAIKHNAKGIKSLFQLQLGFGFILFLLAIFELITGK